MPVTEPVDDDHGDARRIALVGLMGTGKSAVGGLLAERTGRRFVDTDRAVEARCGRSVAAVFAEDGEEVFRALERDVLAEALAEEEPSVVATGGGAVLDGRTRGLLAERAVVVWLTAPVEELATRIDSGGDRPLLAGRDVATALTEILLVRAPLYAEVADIRIDSSAGAPDELASRILDELGARA